MEKYSKYKDSGVQWLGQIPSHWGLNTLRKHLRFVSIKNHPDAQLLSVTREQGVIVRDTESKEENHNFIPDDLSGYKYVEPGDFCINKMKSWQGSYGVSEYEGIVSPAYFICKLAGVDKYFFSTAIRSRAYIPFFAQYSKGIRVGQWDLSPIALMSIPFFLPPLSEQQAIVSYLDDKCGKIDQLLENKAKELELLAEMKQRVIADAVTKGHNPCVKFKYSGIPWLGEIPIHWDIRRIKWLFKEEDEKNTNLEYQLLTFSRSKGIIPFADVNDKAPSASDLTKYKVLHSGQLLENRMQAWSGMFGCSYVEGCVSPDYSVFSPNQNVSTEFYAYLFKTKKYIQQFANASKGIGDGFNRLYTTQFYKIIAVYPPYSEQKAIVAHIEEKVSKIDALAEKLQKEIESIKEYKQRLISDVVTGQIKV